MHKLLNFRYLTEKVHDGAVYGLQVFFPGWGLLFFVALAVIIGVGGTVTAVCFDFVENNTSNGAIDGLNLGNGRFQV